VGSNFALCRRLPPYFITSDHLFFVQWLSSRTVRTLHLFTAFHVFAVFQMHMPFSCHPLMSVLSFCAYLARFHWDDVWTPDNSPVSSPVSTYMSLLTHAHNPCSYVCQSSPKVLTQLSICSRLPSGPVVRLRDFIDLRRDGDGYQAPPQEFLHMVAFKLLKVSQCAHVDHLRDLLILVCNCILHYASALGK